MKTLQYKPQPKPQTSRRRACCVVSIGHRGIYDVKRRVYYYAAWMQTQHGRKVTVYSELFDADHILIYDASTQELLGEAIQRVPKIISDRGKPYKGLSNAL